MIYVLKGKTLRGKNRIRRGGSSWRVRAYDDRWGVLVESLEAGEREMFWFNPSGDPHVEVDPVTYPNGTQSGIQASAQHSSLATPMTGIPHEYRDPGRWAVLGSNQ